MIWMVLLTVLLGAITGGALIGWWVFHNVDARLLLRDQAALIRIDQNLDIRARALNNLEIRLDDTIETVVPVDQLIRIPVDETLKVVADFDGTVPIRMNVAVRDKILIDQELDLDAVVDAEILGETLKLPIRGKVPVRAEVPIALDIPVDQPVALKFTAPVGVQIQQDLSIPLRTEIDAAIPIQADLSVPVKSDILADAEITTRPIAATIVEADLRLPLRTLRLEQKPQQGESTKAR